MADLFGDTPLDVVRLSQAQLDLEAKQRSNPLPWHGQFSPQLAELMLKEFAARGDTVLDPFVGSGTVLHEAAKAGHPSVGAEINPAAVKLARVYELVTLAPTTRLECLAEVERSVMDLCGYGPLFPSRITSESELERELLAGLSVCSDPWQARLWRALIVLSDFGSSSFSTETVLQRWQLLARVVRDSPVTAVPVEVIHGDARRTGLAASSIDMVVTSPPYINVFNYHQRFRKSVEALDWDVLRVAPSEIGANRKHRGNRFLTVVQYCLDIAQVFAEMQRVCRPGARLIFVVGRESNVRGVRFFNGALLGDVARRYFGRPLVLRQERKFLNRFGQTIVEDILHFDVPEEAAMSLVDLGPFREIAARALETASKSATESVTEDIELALAGIHDVGPSPIFSTPTRNTDDR